MELIPPLGEIKSKYELAEMGRYLCRSAQIPAANQGLIEVPFRGRFLKIPGDRTFEPWTATFYNTTDFDLRAAFEQWINVGNKTDESLGTFEFGGDSFGGYFTDIIVRQLDKNPKSEGGTATGVGKNKVLRSYKLVGAYQLVLVQSTFHMIATIRLKNSMLNSNINIWMQVKRTLKRSKGSFLYKATNLR